MRGDRRAALAIERLTFRFETGDNRFSPEHRIAGCGRRSTEDNSGGGNEFTAKRGELELRSTLFQPKGGRQMTVSSTGYCLRGSTATGIPVGWGVIAVDPAVIPLGTRMFIPGYGEGVAAVTGAPVASWSRIAPFLEGSAVMPGSFVDGP